MIRFHLCPNCAKEHDVDVDPGHISMDDGEYCLLCHKMLVSDVLRTGRNASLLQCGEALLVWFAKTATCVMVARDVRGTRRTHVLGDEERVLVASLLSGRPADRPELWLDVG